MNRYKDTNLASLLGIIGNIILLVMKLIVSIISKSQAMLSDTLNSAGDIVSSAMTFFGNKIASKKADEDHNLGHGKAEYIFSLLISIIMLYFSVQVIFSSIKSLFISKEYAFSIYLIIVCILTIIIKFALYIYTNKIAKKYQSLLVQANANDHRNDCVLTTFNLIASIFGYYGITFVDSIVGIIVSTWIMFVAIKLFKEAYDVLMDKGIDESLREKITEIVKKHKEIENLNHLNSTPVGYQYQISITIFVDGNLTTFQSHEIANNLEKEITDLDEIYLTVVHVNPVSQNVK